MSRPFKVQSSFHPAGDQPEAIGQLVEGAGGFGVADAAGGNRVWQDLHHGSRGRADAAPDHCHGPQQDIGGPVVRRIQGVFPHNAVEYFVSYYDYYQPEAYVPSSDTFIEKDASVNEHIEQMRLSATKALLEREDCLVVATVSAIYGLGDPQLLLQDGDAPVTG